MLAQAYNTSTWEAEASRSLGSRPAWARLRPCLRTDQSNRACEEGKCFRLPTKHKMQRSFVKDSRADS